MVSYETLCEAIKRWVEAQRDAEHQLPTFGSALESDQADELVWTPEGFAGDVSGANDDPSAGAAMVEADRNGSGVEDDSEALAS
ncbi:MAG: hypothetical protein B7733_13925 [Myxococcales bacterium FL481]|nr:MAG: hypothetical protein B7733_13925 [Myxococcales bacterium FL481]